MIARGYSLTDALLDLYEFRQTCIFDEFEYGYLLDGLVFGPNPAVAGLDEELRTLDRANPGDRQAAYMRSRLSITDFGNAFRPQGRFLPAQPNRPLVGRHPSDQRQSVALESGAGRAVAALP